ncbi:MAG: protein translocase subunit SecD [Pirellulales bacterium]
MHGLSLLSSLLAQVAPAAPAVDAPWYQSSYVLAAIVVAVLVLPFGIGAWMARSLKMPDYGWKIGLVLCTITAGVVVTYFGWPPKRGIDLAGGVILVYEVQGKEDVEMDKLVAAIRRRLDPAGVKELTIRPYGPRQIEIIIPQVDSEEIALIKRKISSAGLLEFRITADPQVDSAIAQRALADPTGRGVRETDVRASKANAAEQPLIEAALKTQANEVRLDNRVARWDVVPEADRAALSANADLVTRQTPRGLEVLVIQGRDLARWEYVGKGMNVDPSRQVLRVSPNGRTEILMLSDPYHITGSYLVRASQGIDEAGRNSVNFSLNSRGGQLFGALTGANLPNPATRLERHLGIVLDHELLSAPAIQSRITDNGQITGQFTQDDISFLVGILNAGSLPATLNPLPISEQTISPTLGEDTIQQGVRSMLIASLLVLGFMLVYYRFAGLVACAVLLLNLLLVVALMITVKAAFTLPGLAGLALTVGMAVDANVLIYERMREELARGAALRMAIRNGFERATSTIIDANVTTLIVAVVLYAIGTDQIKGFAVTLILGLVLSMYTAIFCARVVFDIVERKRWVTSLKMMKMLENTNFDFVAYYKPALLASAVVIGIGLVAVGARGKGLLDIDFTGGSSVHILFAEGKAQSIADVRAKVTDLPDVTVVSIGKGEDGKNYEFKIDTSERERDVVQKKLIDLFGPDLRRNHLQFADLTQIDANAPPSSTAPAAPAATEPAKGPEGKQSSARQPLPPDTWLALAQDAAPQTPPAETPAESTPAQPAAAETPVPQPPAEAKATETPKAPSEDSPVPAATEPSAAPKTEAPAAPATTPAEPAKSSNAFVPGGATTLPVAAPPVDPFLGGTSAKLTFAEPINHDGVAERIREAFSRTGQPEVNFALAAPNYVEGSNTPFEVWTIKFAGGREQLEKVLGAVQERLAAEPVFPSSSTIGQKVAGDTQFQALYALLISLVGIIVYVWFRFSNLVWGVASVVALVHDVLVMLAAIALSAYVAPFLGFLLVDPVKISLTIVAAFLTIIGFSINDTIVIFDRMREIKGKSPDLTPKMINDAVNQTLSRSIITSLTVLIVVVILYIWGGEAMHGFAFALLVGVISGTYSTIYIAAPLALWMGNKGEKKPAAAARVTQASQPKALR